MSYSNKNIRDILTKYISDTEQLHQSEDYHDLENFAYYYGGFEKDKSFYKLMKFLLEFFSKHLPTFAKNLEGGSNADKF